MIARVACLHPVGWDAVSALTRGLADHDVLATNRLEEIDGWLDQDAVDVVLLVLAPGDRELAAIIECIACYPRMPVIALVHSVQLSGQTTRRLVVDYCHDYHSLPLDIDRLRISVGHAIGLYRLWRERREEPVTPALPDLVGESPPMQALFRDLEKVAAVDAPVLISGESGTGKELAARAVHRGSDARDGPFVVVNCGAIPASLIAAELFGYERGAFTGADCRREGRLEKADGGTVFLDEIADLPLDLQGHLLRFLQEGTVDRLGSHESITVRARVIAASHVPLADAVQAGRVREDLYYRLNVLNVRMPALRERREDVPLLATHFLERFRRERNNPCRGFTPQAVRVMENHDWPGNVRELINCVHRAAIMADGPLINARHLGLERRRRLRMERLETLDEARRCGELAALRAALNETGHNVSAAARQLGVSRVTLYRLMQRHGIDFAAFARPDRGALAEGLSVVRPP